MKLFICVIATAVVALTAAGDAFADASKGQAYFSVMGSYIDDDDDRNIDDGINGGQFGFGWAISQGWNVEAMMSASHGEGAPDYSYTGLGVDLQRVFRRDERFSPYLLAGLGYFDADPVGQENEDGSMYSLGAGFYYDLGSSNVALRGEWRSRTDSAGPDDLTDNLWSLGLQLPFGSGAPKWVDSDGDGVSDSLDRCPNTPAGTQVDAYGCELDSDGDGVVDSLDQCPNTPSGVSVDSRGCPLDSDRDGVPDDLDECPNTPAGAKVDAKGCELDSDGDGVVDSKDECPNTPKGDPVDKRGCTLRGEYVLQGTEFELNSDRLTAESIAVLSDVVDTLKRYPDLTFEIGGHTDSTGAADYNMGLSARRAQTVHDFLASKGIAVSRMSVKGYGETRPIESNDTDAGRAANRRVSLRANEE
ncbi:MAG TPA: OmpA family protein [Woeseiaceae bacterium]|nr:OmpA family protein [Woeseiaceae bacterium]